MDICENLITDRMIIYDLDGIFELNLLAYHFGKGVRLPEINNK